MDEQQNNPDNKPEKKKHRNPYDPNFKWKHTVSKTFPNLTGPEHIRLGYIAISIYRKANNGANPPKIRERWYQVAAYEDKAILEKAKAVWDKLPRKLKSLPPPPPEEKKGE